MQTVDADKWHRRRRSKKYIDSVLRCQLVSLDEWMARQSRNHHQTGLRGKNGAVANENGD